MAGSNYYGRHVAFEADHRSFGEYMESEIVRKLAVEVAGDIAGLARAGSARSNGPGPHMADLWEVNATVGNIRVGKRQNSRAFAEVFNPDIAAAAQEFGAGPRRGQRTRLLAKIASKFGDFHDHGDGED